MQQRKTMRNVSKNRFLTCFRPVNIDAMLEPRTVVDRSTTRRFACIPLADKHDTNNSTTKPTFSNQELAQNWVVPHPQKRTLSKNTRAGNRNLDGQNCFGPKRGYSAHTESSSTGDEKQVFVDTTNSQKIKAPDWSSSISSSNSPECESKNIFKSESSKDQVEKQNKFQCVGICWVLVSVAVTVFYGKIIVIILTLILGCFLCLLNASCCWIKEILKLQNGESEAYNNSRRVGSGKSGRNKERF